MFGFARSLQISMAAFMLLTAPVAQRSSAADNSETVEGAKVVTWHGYQSAIELANADYRVVLCPEIGGRVLEYSHRNVNVRRKTALWHQASSFSRRPRRTGR